MIDLKNIFDLFIPKGKQVPNTLKQKTIASGFWIGISGIATNLTIFLRTIVYARILTPEIFGLMGLCRTIINSIEALTKPGIGAALVYHNKQYEESKSTAFTIMVLRGVVLCIITIVLSDFIGTFYDEKELTKIIRIIAIVFIIKGLKNINTVDYIKRLEFKKLTILTQITNIVSFVFSIFIVLILKNIWALVVSEIIFSALHTLLSYVIIPGYPKFKLNKELAYKLIKYGKFISGSVIIIFIFESIDNIVIGKILNMKELGFYVFSYSIATLTTKQVNSVISSVAFPAFSKMNNDIIRIKKAYKKMLTLVCFLIIPISIGIFALSEELIVTIFGKKWFDSIRLLEILCFIGALRSINETAHPMLSGIGKPNYVLKIVTARVVIFIIFLVPLTVIFGLIGACYSGLIALSAESFITINVVKRVLNCSIRDFSMPLVHPLISSLLMFLFIYLIKQYYLIDSIIMLISIIIISALIYFVVSISLNKQYIAQVLKSVRIRKGETSISS